MCLVPLFLHDQRLSCGKCPECLKALRSDWIYRCEKESEVHRFNYFFTLTFNEDHLPPDEQGVWDCFTRFRKAYFAARGSFPYFVSMERGDLHGRLHLHLLMYSDKPVPKDLVRHLWPNGFIKRGRISPKRIRYACSYMFNPDMLNKVKMYRSSNNFGGVPLVPFRIRKTKFGLKAVPLPRYYCKKFHACGVFARKYYDSLYHDTDFDSVYFACRERFNKLRGSFGQKKERLSYEQFLARFIEARVRKYNTFKDPRDLIAFPGPDHVMALSKTYRELLARVKPFFAFYGVRASSNLWRYLTIDCSMSLRGAQNKNSEWRFRHKKPPNFVFRDSFNKKQLTILP